VQIAGRSSEYVRVSDEGNEERIFRFCPECGATVFYTTSDAPGLIAVPLGAFADPSFPPPSVSVYESRRHSWVGLPATVERDDVWESLRPLYESGEYAEVADRGRELIESHPEYAELLYNVACCESRAGRTGDAIEHLRRAIDRTEYLRTLAGDDSDFDPIRHEPAFRELVRAGA
jgi:tetratricopeptide (TPR) repeat protein